MRIHFVVVDDEGLAEQGSSSVFVAHFWRMDENRVHYAVEAYVGVVVGGVGIHHWELEVRQRVSHVGYVGRQLGSEIEEASSVVRPIHDETCLIHHRRHRRPYLFPFH